MRYFEFVVEAARIDDKIIKNIIFNFKSGFTYLEIAKSLGIKYDTVKKYVESSPDFESIKRIHTAILNKRRREQEAAAARNRPLHPKTDEIVDLYKQGNSESTIAVQLNLGRAVVRRVLQNLPNYTDIRAEHDKHVIKHSERARVTTVPFDETAMAELYKTGMGEKNIANKFGTTIGIVRGILRRMPDYYQLKLEHDSNMPEKNKLSDPNIMKQFIDMYINGANIVELSNNFKISRSFAWKVGKNLSQEIQDERNKKLGEP